MLTSVTNTNIDQSGNIAKAVKTAITNTEATKIELPPEAGTVLLIHITDSDLVWLGDSDILTANGDDAWPLPANTPITLSLKKGNSNSLYGITSTGAATIYALGVVKG